MTIVAPEFIAGVLGSLEREREVRLRSRTEGSADAVGALRAALKTMSKGDAAKIEDALRFARGLQYRHPGLTADAYLAHPIRMAALALQLTEPANATTGVIALLHNVIEVTSVTRAALNESFGAAVATAVEVLTVDRSRQHEPAYDACYYDRIRRSQPGVRLVKILDKLDNLFLLDINPSREVRRTYLEEIEREILPMTRDVAPRLLPYFTMLIADERARLGERLP